MCLSGINLEEPFRRWISVEEHKVSLKYKFVVTKKKKECKIYNLEYDKSSLIGDNILNAVNVLLVGQKRN